MKVAGAHTDPTRCPQCGQGDYERLEYRIGDAPECSGCGAALLEHATPAVRLAAERVRLARAGQDVREAPMIVFRDIARQPRARIIGGLGDVALFIGGGYVLAGPAGAIGGLALALVLRWWMWGTLML